MGSNKYGITFLVGGILILSYLLFTFIAGTVYIMNNYQYIHSNQHWDQLGGLPLNLISNFLLIVIFVMVFIIPGVFLIKTKKAVN
ncbi:hypothetical protein LCGC14_0951440 [marine sediment metagenome]|uniref:Uncharacterized protein n=1 Tax=marine sediment metagenome TaxID=412755 RepID=A0A0F9NLU8_9ZZZZ